MKIDIDKLGETYDVCIANGMFREKNSIDVALIKSLRDVSLQGLKFIKERSKGIPRDSTDWTFVFRDHYESLRGLIEACLLFDRIEAESHQCKNSYICVKHPELDLDWEFLETVRLKRNAINYRGQLLKYDDWKPLSLGFDLHVNVLARKIDEKLSLLH
jgi:hypothetical protein